MSENEMLVWFQIEPYLFIARTIKSSPKTARRVSKSRREQKKLLVGKRFWVRKKLNEDKTGEMLGNLEKAGAIEYTGTNWKITPIGRKDLQKYFE